MATPTVADYLKYANLQMAAEALYGFDANKGVVPVDGKYSGQILDAGVSGDLFQITDSPTVGANLEWRRAA
ncbi:MAG TPA: hypothetical protein VFW68_01755 [Rhodocyclaceae bacterium]|nr:hypothetical protein [Rhodocyclaceae bacterium]